ncbi:MAG: glucose-1-phosphate thymidylyltransferase RfbA, partial [Pseudomonadota bacterium]
LSKTGMSCYPLSVLMQAGLRDILVITTPNDAPAFENLLGDGERWGINIEYAQQPSPDGLAQALIIAEDFLDGAPSALILGDNLFFGQAFGDVVAQAAKCEAGATVFGYRVSNPSAYGVVSFDETGKVLDLIEKPVDPPSNYAVTGLYFYDEHAPSLAKTIKPSARGELEITTLNQLYLQQDKLRVETLSDGTTWLDTGTHRSLLQAAQFVSVIEERQGIRICCPEVVAYKKGWIDADQLDALSRPLIKSGYGNYLSKVAKA